MENVTIENAKGTLQSILQTIDDQEARKQDYIAPTNAMHIETREGNTNVILEGTGGMPTQTFETNEVAFNQLSATAEIDVRTARRLRDNYSPEFDALMNKIFETEPKNKMLRTFDGERPLLRAVVSDKFKTFDNADLIRASLPQLIDSPAAWQVVNGSVTDQRLSLRLKSRNQLAEPAVGDHMANGIALSNSETGNGAVSVTQMFWTLACLNGMQTENKTRNTHVTSARGGDQWELLKQETKDADNRALELKLRDIVASYASRESFDEMIEVMKRAHNDTVENGLTNPTAVVDAVVSVLSLPKKSTESLMAGFMQTIQQPGYVNKPVSRATLVNAVTAVAHTVDADDVDDWYSHGSTVLNLPRNQWETIANAA
jgi:hypothetical protein